MTSRPREVLTKLRSALERKIQTIPVQATIAPRKVNAARRGSVPGGDFFNITKVFSESSWFREVPSITMGTQARFRE